MNRRSLGFYLIAGLFFWGIPAVFVTGFSAIIYTFCAALPVWIAFRKSPPMPVGSTPSDRLGEVAVTILAGLAFLYVTLDVVFGQNLFQYNLFIFGAKSVDRIVEQNVTGVSAGRGVGALLGVIIGLLPFCLLDAAVDASRIGRIALWVAALLMFFYGVTTSRGAVILCVLTVFLGKSSNWRRTAIGGTVAALLFTLASRLRGDYGNTGSPLRDAVSGPYINLMLMRISNCGTAPWYSFVGEFFKKFIPAFLFPKAIYSFNMEMSLCIYPTADNGLSAVSIFTWLGEIYHYTPSILTALSAGTLLGVMGRLVDQQLVMNRLPVSRVAVGLACMTMLRSRTLDVLTYLIGELIFLFFWPHLRRLAKYLRHCVPSPSPTSALPEPQKDTP
jgi:hypothetical protein